MKFIITTLLCIFLFHANNCFGRDIKSGYYGCLSIINNDGELYGYCAFYDVRKGRRLTPSQFYFYGKATENDTTAIKIAFTGIAKPEVINGYIVSLPHDSINLVLPAGYLFGNDSIYFYPNGYKADLDGLYDDFISLGVIKDSVCRLYNDADKSITKGYLIKGDHVDILQVDGIWTEIMYQSEDPAIQRKQIIRWIKSSALYDKDPAKWK